MTDPTKKIGGGKPPGEGVIPPVDKEGGGVPSAPSSPSLAEPAFADLAREFEALEKGRRSDKAAGKKVIQLFERMSKVRDGEIVDPAFVRVIRLEFGAYLAALYGQAVPPLEQPPSSAALFLDAIRERKITAPRSLNMSEQLGVDNFIEGAKAVFPIEPWLICLGWMSSVLFKREAICWVWRKR